MIYLTGDVHTRMKRNWEQKGINSELDVTKKYLEILKKYGVSCTLFVNGICLEREPEKIRELLKYDIEMGGHTYNNFGSMNLMKSYINRKLFGCIYGSARFQKKDIKKTKKAFENFGLEMKSWRTHALGSNKNTFKILKENNVKYVSDLIGEIRPYEDEEIIHMPINIPVDVITIAYGETKPENRNPFASCVKGRIKPDEWFEIIKKRVMENEKKRISSILLIHPITMAVLDDFKLFEKIAKFLSEYPSRKISQIRINN